MDLPTPAAVSSSTPRRVAAVGLVRRTGGRTLTLTATPAGATGRIRPTRPCAACKGDGGRIEDTSGDGVIRRSWHTCRSCRGTGAAR